MITYYLHKFDGHEEYFIGDSKGRLYYNFRIPNNRKTIFKVNEGVAYFTYVSRLSDELTITVQTFKSRKALSEYVFHRTIMLELEQYRDWETDRKSVV